MTTRSANKPKTLDHLKSRKTRLVRSVRIGTDDEAIERYEEIKQQLSLAKGRATRFPHDSEAQSALDNLQKEFSEVEKEMAEHSIKFSFQSLGYKAYDQLVEAHTLDQEALDKLVETGKLTKQAAEVATWDPETFPFALIVECMIEPELANGEREEMIEWLQGDDWNASEIQVLFQTATEANLSSRVVELGNG